MTALAHPGAEQLAHFAETVMQPMQTAASRGGESGRVL